MIGELTCVHLGFGEHAIPYEQAWAVQREVHDAVASGTRGDTCLLLEHEPVYTAGKRTEAFERPVAGGDGTPVVDVDRGGKITWHGPGQLVGYPIVRLPDPVDVVAYVRRVEEVLIRTCADLGLRTGRIEGRSGVWLPPDAGGRPARKVGAIGIRVSRGVTMHGFALNCANDLDPYHRIVPCGITDAGVTTLSVELGRRVGVAEALAYAERHLADVLGYPGVTHAQMTTISWSLRTDRGLQAARSTESPRGVATNVGAGTGAPR